MCLILVDLPMAFIRNLWHYLYWHSLLTPNASVKTAWTLFQSTPQHELNQLDVEHGFFTTGLLSSSPNLINLLPYKSNHLCQGRHTLIINKPCLLLLSKTNIAKSRPDSRQSLGGALFWIFVVSLFFLPSLLLRPNSNELSERDE